METKTCPDCGCTTTPNNYKRHIGSKHCLLNQQNEKSTKIDDSWLLENGKYQCPHCDKEYSKNGIGTHIWRTHGEGQNWTANIDGYKDGTRKGTNGFIKGTQVEHSDETKKKISEKATGRIIDYSTREKISESMKIAHKEGRAHNIGQSRWNNEMSYPEKFFTLVIENEFTDKKYINEFPVGIYSIDFAWVDKKRAIEIDGDQHEKPDYKTRDKRKDKKLNEEGWKVLRIKWKDLYENTKEWIQIAKEFIH
jgi:very-short-patch-repair endonuclease